MKKDILVLLGCIVCGYFLITMNFGCAQISAPTGGPKDTLAPVLVKASPEEGSINFTGNKISLAFNEYIDMQELQNNLIISPVQKTNPVISYNLKSISVKFKDTLLPNTTYSINFGNSIRDVHEGNILKDFTYVFSTGSSIDSLIQTGKVVLAESGKADSTIMVMLYRNLNDTAVLKNKPDYITRLDKEGNFKFKHLPNTDFKIYALKDGDGGKTYNSKSELFAFTDTIINSSLNTIPIVLYAYAEKKSDDGKITPVLKAAADKKLRFTTNLEGLSQDLLQPLEFTFNNPIKIFDPQKPVLSDTNYKPIPNTVVKLDSTHKKLSVITAWKPETDYMFVMPKDAVTDSTGLTLPRTDTFRFSTKKETDYGTILIRFANLDVSKHPVIQFMEGDNVKYAYPIVGTEWSNKRFPPGEYGIRILYDLNNDGVWTPGNYTLKLQPEKATQLQQKINIKAGWDNERDIKL